MSPVALDVEEDTDDTAEKDVEGFARGALLGRAAGKVVEGEGDGVAEEEEAVVGTAGG